jgi:hypothetical protein
VKQSSGTRERRRESQRRLIRWGEATPIVTFPPVLAVAAGQGESAVFYEMWTYPQDMLRLTEPERSFQELATSLIRLLCLSYERPSLLPDTAIRPCLVEGFSGG